MTKLHFWLVPGALLATENPKTGVVQMQNGFVFGFPLQKQAGSFADLAAFSVHKSTVSISAIRGFAEAAQLSEDYHFLGIFRTLRLLGSHSLPSFAH